MWRSCNTCFQSSVVQRATAATRKNNKKLPDQTSVSQGVSLTFPIKIWTPYPGSLRAGSLKHIVLHVTDFTVIIIITSGISSGNLEQ